MYMLVRPMAASVLCESRSADRAPGLACIRLRRRKFFLPFVQQAGGEMRFGILRREFGSLAVSLECVFRLFIFEQMREREPGAGLTFFYVIGGFERCGGAQKLLGLGIIGADEHQAEVEVGFKNVGLGGDGLAICGDRFVGAAEAVQSESEIEPCLIIVGIFIESLFQQRFRGGEIVFLDGIFGLSDFRRLVVDAFLVMADGSVGLREGAGRLERQAGSLGERAVHALGYPAP